MKTTKPSIYYSPDSHGTRCVENASRGLRIVGKSHDVNRSIRHTGWYLDDECLDETVCGAVLQMPAKDGTTRYLPAIRDPYIADCYIVDFRHWTDDEQEAARFADRMVEHYAEREREYQRAERARQRAADCRESIRMSRKELCMLMREYRTGNPSSVAGYALLRTIAGVRKSIRDDIKIIRNLES